jgi:hypothetical protein
MSISGISSSVSKYQTNQVNPFTKIKQNFESLGKALESGSLDDAKKAYAKIQEKIAQGPPAGGPGGAKKASASNAGSQSDTKAYEKMNINKDGTVSTEGKMVYAMQNPADVNNSQQHQKGSGKVLGSIVDTSV